MDFNFTIAYKGRYSDFYRPFYGIEFKSYESAKKFLDLANDLSCDDVNFVIFCYDL